MIIASAPGPTAALSKSPPRDPVPPGRGPVTVGWFGPLFLLIAVAVILAKRRR